MTMEKAFYVLDLLSLWILIWVRKEYIHLSLKMLLYLSIL